MGYAYENYHRHSMYTNPRISDCAVSNKDYAKRAVELGHQVLSSCEHAWQGNVWDVYKLTKEFGLKMLVAAEAYWVKDRLDKDNSNCHIWIGAKNENGRQCLNDVLSEANLSGFYGRPRLDPELILQLPKNDIWVTTACVAYWKYDDIEDITAEFARHFGNNFFLEVQYHNTPEQIALNQRILKLRDKLKVPIIMGCDSHYIHEKDAQIRTDFLFSKGLEYPEETGWYMDYPDSEAAYNRFARQGVLNHAQIEEAMSNTLIFREVEEYDCPIFTTDIKLPSMYPDWTQEQKDEEYKRLVYTGWDAYKTSVPEEKWPQYEQEIASEIQVVVDTKMADYFIIDHHIIKKGKENGGWLTKTGRGSAVSFFTNKLLGFTEVDRIAASVHMYPDRFMSTERILQSGSLPDIDMNMADPEPFARAQKEILGEDHAYPMLAYGAYKTSAAWKLYAKSQGVPFDLANAVSSQIAKYEDALKHADEDEKDDISVDDYIEPQYREIFAKSADYLGLVTSWSIAPCAYLLYQGSIRREIGLVRIKDHVCAAIDGKWAEEAHFLKNDLLTVQVVNLIYQGYKRIGIEPPTVQELLKWCADDPSPWELYHKGCTLCLNQVEKTGTSARAGIYKPNNISELCAFIAAIRPGFKSMYRTFESRVPFKYDVKAFDDLIQTEEMPHSFVLYQEQEMAALNYAGIPMADCYTAIKNIAKKRVEKVLAYKEVFKAGFMRTMIEDEHMPHEKAEEMTNQLWQIMEDSASYSFNASHSYCVALDSLYGAWLKCHHPLEFYEVALRIYEKKGNKDKMNALKEEAEKYFDIKFPPFRWGQDNRAIVADVSQRAITNSIGSIKGFGKTVAETLWKANRELLNPSFMELLTWLDRHGLKDSKVRPLVKIDYFQEFGNSAELLRLMDAFAFFKEGTAKTVKKDKLNPEMEAFIKRHGTDKGAKGNELKSYSITDMPGLLEELEAHILSLSIPDLSFKLRAANHMDILGYVDLTTYKEADRRKLYILDRFEMKNRVTGTVWLYKLRCKSVGSGKMSMLDLQPWQMKELPVLVGDMIYAKRVHKSPKGYWNLVDYEVIFE